MDDVFKIYLILFNLILFYDLFISDRTDNRKTKDKEVSHQEENFKMGVDIDKKVCSILLIPLTFCFLMFCDGINNPHNVVDDKKVAKSIFLLEYLYSDDIFHNAVVLGNVSNNSKAYKLLEEYLASGRYMYWEDSLDKEKFMKYFNSKENDVQILQFDNYPWFYVYINGNRYFLSDIDAVNGNVRIRMK